MYLKIIPRHIANPKLVQFCKECNKIFDWSTSMCLSCNVKLNKLEFISYLLSLHKEEYIKVCPCCNSYDFDVTECQTSIDNWERGFNCNNCGKNFKFTKNANKNQWFLENFPELVSDTLSPSHI
jgi:hypothetical protein